MTTPIRSTRLAITLALALGATALPVAAAGTVGTVKSVEGQVMMATGEGEEFGLAEVGAELPSGGVIVVMEDSTAVLDLAGKGEVTLSDMASLKLEAPAAGGEYSTVTGVRAPVLFLFPTGQTSDLPPGPQALTFGINHDLDKVKGVPKFRVLALHEDDEAELEGDSDGERIDAARVVAEFETKAKTVPADYTWYNLMTSEDLDAPGEYTVFLVGIRGDETVKLGQETLVYVEEAEE